MKAKILEDMKRKMNKVLEILAQDLARVRTGRASVALLEGIKVEAYDTTMPLPQVASLAAPEPRLLTVQPWDPTLLADIEKAILKSDLGLTPANDGKLIRLPIPALTTERRKELVKVVKKMGEDAKVSLRNVRREGNDRLKDLKKDKEISEDEAHRAQDEVQKSPMILSRRWMPRPLTKNRRSWSFNECHRRSSPSCLPTGFQPPAPSRGHNHGRQRPLGQRTRSAPGQGSHDRS